MNPMAPRPRVPTRRAALLRGAAILVGGVLLTPGVTPAKRLDGYALSYCSVAFYNNDTSQGAPDSSSIAHDARTGGRSRAERSAPDSLTRVPGSPIGPDGPASADRRTRSIPWPDGTEILSFENLEGIILVSARSSLASGPDTSGAWVLDTGAGYLVMDAGLARRSGVSASDDSIGSPDPEPIHGRGAGAGRPRVPEGVGLALRPLARFVLGSLERDQVSPLLTFDARMVRDITDQPVLGLVGEQIYGDRALWIDYQNEVLALIPSAAPGATQDPIAHSRATLAGVLGPSAMGTPFRIAGDGKVLVAARVADASPARRSGPLTLVVDTGSSKTVLFQRSLAGVVRGHERWRSIRGLSAPTLAGPAAARVARVPALMLEPSGEPRGSARGAPSSAGAPRLERTEVVIVDSPLQAQLSQATRCTIHGLLGYSFLRHFRVVVDYPGRVLWLDPVSGAGDERPHEYSHVGIQLERRDGAARVVAVAVGSPAERAGVGVEDEVVAVDGREVAAGGLIEASRRLEGPPGTVVTLTLRRSGATRELRLRRVRLL